MFTWLALVFFWFRLSCCNNPYSFYFVHSLYSWFRFFNIMFSFGILIRIHSDNCQVEMSFCPPKNCGNRHRGVKLYLNGLTNSDNLIR
jgi:hypothetical protein